MSSKTASENAATAPTFEQLLQRLEEIVRALEEGKLGLGEALTQYEEGVKLLRQSYEILDRAQRRIELLTGVDADGNPITRPLGDEATYTAGEEPPRRGRPRSGPEV